MISKPMILFLDEPTSGLDSASALKIMECLKKFANYGIYLKQKLINN